METGCIFGGHRGQYIFGDIIELALSNGFEISEADRTELDGEGWTATDLCIELSEDAERHLNDHVAEPGHSFGWSDGEYFYATDEWWQSEGS